ncbi:hypothetical protein ACHWQZ_G019414 [Mnemiopsis leidyi]
MSDTTCSYSDWRTVWIRNVKKIEFPYGTASVYYRGEPCSAGTYRSTDQTSCVPCEEGTVSTETGATSCTSCDLGKEANSDRNQCVECGDGTYRNSSVTSCTSCTAGTISNENRTRCERLCPGLSVEKAEVSPSGDVRENTMVTVTCLKPKHYVLFGKKEVTCQSTGWSPKPECRKCGKIL